MVEVPWNSELEMIVRQNCPDVDDDTPILPSDVLKDLGLDSMGTVTVIVEIEETFGVVFPDDDMSFETFTTMDSLWRTVSRLTDSCPDQQP
ncbi:phosphopantetheine-binding protein [Streptomyces silvisoli]|uniref:Phosphopantetheine-binding protein n=1 Tax=Streptomyces silvisoli TaxID=3034235 RepID=A0ABT5ZMN8_9ACTN|nr:phosphopantetheine-binding protein [Streptomyces silvisoli]MDF3290273.1 phosphopantetheine-binding protein [Streptomyces silvisoli]